MDMNKIESKSEINHDISDRFIYKKGDINIGRVTKVKCKYFEIKDNNNGIKKDNAIE